MTVITIVVGALGTVMKNLEKRLTELEIEEGVEILKDTILIKSARILKRVMDILGDLLSLDPL